MYTYSYLIGVLLLCAVWVLLFVWRKDTRRELTFVSVIFGLVGPAAEPFYTTDWWHPLTITATSVGPEDLLFGFTIGGIAAVLYEVLFRRKLRHLKSRRDIYPSFVLTIVFLLPTLFFLSFYVLHLNSFFSSVIALAAPIILMWSFRADLIPDSICSGTLVALVLWIDFLVMHFVSPGWVERYWYLDKLSGILLYHAPLEDLIWAFLAGAYIGPLYEFWYNLRIVSVLRKKQ